MNINEELSAMNDLYLILSQLKPKAQKRVLAWVSTKLSEDQPTPASLPLTP